MARVVGFVGVLGLITGVGCLARSRAQIDRTLLELGASVSSWPRSSHELPRTLELNGAKLSIETQVLQVSLPQVLRFARDACMHRSKSGGHGRLLARMAILSREDANSGYVACVALSADGLPTLAEQISRFAETWDLGHLGPLRYVYASKSETQSEDGIFVLTVKADDSVDLRSLLPIGRRDASGGDLQGVPRPPGATRLLSASEVSGPSSVYVYLVSASVDQVLEQYYRDELRVRGWSLVERYPREVIELDGIRMLSAKRGKRLVSVLAHPVDGQAGIVTLLSSEAE